jgi:hypothetical protein
MAMGESEPSVGREVSVGLIQPVDLAHGGHRGRVGADGKGRRKHPGGVEQRRYRQRRGARHNLALRVSAMA